MRMFATGSVGRIGHWKEIPSHQKLGDWLARGKPGRESFILMTESQEITPRLGPPELDTRQEQCPQHGSFTSTPYWPGRSMLSIASSNAVENSWSTCPTCRDELIERQQVERWKRETQERLYSMIKEIGIPPRFRGKTLDTFQAETDEQRRALAIAREYVTNFAEHRKAGRCLIFLGGIGCGKTHLALAIALAIVQNSPLPPVEAVGYGEIRNFGRHVRYWTVQEIIRALRDTWCRESQISEREVLDKLTALDLLILDEIGLSFGSEAEKNQLFEVINRRYNASRPTLVISNLDLKGITAFIGERTIDRFRENGGKVFTFRGKSWRSRKVEPEEQVFGSAQSVQ
jgi:DNA replication protein DnaC